MGANLLIHDIPGNMPLTNDKILSGLFTETVSEIFGEGNVEHTPWNCGTSDLGDISCLMPTIHPYVAGAEGTGHGSDYYLVDPVRACVSSAKVLAAMTVKLLMGEGEKAKEVLEHYQPVFKTTEEYFDAINAIKMCKKTVVYNEDGTVVLDFQNK